MKQLLEDDFGMMYDAEQAFQNAPNLTVLWWDAEKQSMLNLYASTVGTGERITSDFERFRALCRLMPQLKGNAVRHHCEDFLARHFGWNRSIDEQSCGEIWHSTAESLLTSPRSVADIIGEGRRCMLSSESLLEGWNSQRIPVMLNASGLPTLNVRDWNEWLILANERIERFAEARCDRVYLKIPRGYTFEEPNLYRVGEVLLTKRRSMSEQSLLITQTLRYLCERCTEREWILYLCVESSAEESIRLLEYLARAVGLPAVRWMTSHSDTRDTLLSFGFAETRKNSFLPLICLSDHPSDGELERTVAEYAARFPVGLLRFACGGDLRNAYAEEERLDRVLSKYENQ